MGFSSLKFGNWRQFAEINLSFHARLTVLTGPNGVGKSSLLNLLAIHFETQPTWTSVPVYWSGKFGYTPDVKVRVLREIATTVLPNGESGSVIGEIQYVGSTEPCVIYSPSTIEKPLIERGSFTLALENKHDLSGCHISSLRPLSMYYEISETKPIVRKPANELLVELNTVLEQGPQNLGLILKRQLLANAPEDNPYLLRREPPEWFEKFRQVVADALPPEIGFRTIIRRNTELVVQSASGDFSFDGSSSGIKSVIFICWKITLASQVQTNFTVTIDEPDSHLHPAMQQTFMSSLLRNFPAAQFIVATHSPFTITSSPESAVYVIRFGERGVISELLETSDLKSSTPDEVLKDVLGLPFTMPIWAAKNLELIVERYSEATVNADSVRGLASELKQAGLGDFLPESLELLNRIRTDDQNQ